VRLHLCPQFLFQTSDTHDEHETSMARVRHETTVLRRLHGMSDVTWLLRLVWRTLHQYMDRKFGSSFHFWSRCTLDAYSSRDNPLHLSVFRMNGMCLTCSSTSDTKKMFVWLFRYECKNRCISRGRVQPRTANTVRTSVASPEPGSNRGERNLYSDEMWHRRYTVLHSVNVDLRCYILSP
jgi:hypothetical protein